MNLADFHFIRPYWLLALLPYAAIASLIWRKTLSRSNWLTVCDEDLLPFLLQDKAVAQKRWPYLSGSLAALLSIFALAGPAWERLPMPVFRNDSALVIVLDLSKTMGYADLKPDRTTQARFKISDILRLRKDGQTALIAYSDQAFTVTPLTNDTDTIDSQLAALSPNIMPADGNSIGHAFDLAKSLFKQAGLQNGQILLVTDGGGIEEGVRLAKKLENYRLLVLGIGTTNNEPIPLPTHDFVKDEKGNILLSKMDLEGMMALAQAGKGIFQPITTDESDVKTLMAAVENQTREQGEKNEHLLLEQWRDQGPLLLFLVVPLAALTFRKGLLSVAFLMLIPFPQQGHALTLPENWRDWWQTQDQQAQAAYNQGDYKRAAELFKNSDWKAAAEYKAGAFDKALEALKDGNSANQFYNKGNALAQSGQLQQALDAYKQALKLNPADEDAQFNKELVEKEIEKQKQQQQQDQQNSNQQDQDSKDSQNSSKNQDKSESQQSNPNQDSKQQDEQDEQKDSGKDSKATNSEGQDQKPEQKPEQSQQSAEQLPEKQEDKEQQKPQTAGKQQPKPATQDEKNKDQQKAQAAEALDPMSKEEQEAAEQWLKRIPDDPAGLLRRKFQSQYEQRGRQ